MLVASFAVQHSNAMTVHQQEASQKKRKKPARDDCLIASDDAAEGWAHSQLAESELRRTVAQQSRAQQLPPFSGRHILSAGCLSSFRLSRLAAGQGRQRKLRVDAQQLQLLQQGVWRELPAGKALQEDAKLILEGLHGLGVSCLQLLHLRSMEAAEELMSRPSDSRRGCIEANEPLCCTA